MLKLNLPKHLETRLDCLSKKTGRPKTFYAKEALLYFLDDLEDIYLALSKLGKEPIPEQLEQGEISPH